MRIVMALSALLLCLTLTAAAAEWEVPVVNLQAWGIEHAEAIACDGMAKKVYVGTRSRGAERAGLLVFDLAADGTVAEPPRQYADHPDPLPTGQWSVISTLLLDHRHHKLFLGVSASAPEFTKSLVAYDLDAQGEPTGPPRAYANGNPNVSTWALALHPTLNRLYCVGWGGAAVYALDLDAQGWPAEQPLVFPVGGQGKISLHVRADGSKLYLGTYPCTIEVCDLDAKGDLINTAQTIPIAGGPHEYLRMTANERGIYFTGAEGTLAYLPLDAAGHAAAARQVTDLRPRALAASGDDRLLIAIDSTFTDALTGMPMVDGVLLQEFALDADGTPGAVLRATAASLRQAALTMSAVPTPALVTRHTGWGVQGNRISGLHLRATLTTLASDAVLPPYHRTITTGPQQKYLRFVYAAKHDTAYAAFADGVVAVPLQAETAPVPYPGDASDVLALDEALDVLYMAGKDRQLLVRPVQAGGALGEVAETIATDFTIARIAIHPLTHTVYLMGEGPDGPPANVTTAAARRIVRVPCSSWISDVAVDPVRGRLYAVSGYNGDQNIWVWRLRADGALADPQPRLYADGIPQGADAVRNLLGGLKIDSQRNRLYTGGRMENDAGQGWLITYTLNEQGDPIGAPRLVPTGNPARSVLAIELSADGQWLYESGWGHASIYAHQVDAAGDPAAAYQIWPLGGQGKSQLLLTADGAHLLAASYPAIVEMVAMRNDGQALGGVQAVLTVDEQQHDFGMLYEGSSTSWISLDAGLRDGVGIAGATLELKGAPLTQAAVQIEIARQDDDTLQPMATLTANLAGNVARIFLPRYGLDDPSTLPSLMQTSAMRYRQYLAHAQAVALSPEERPQQFVVANGLIGVDASAEAMEYGMQTLAALGHNTAQIWNFPGVPPAAIYDAATRNGITRFRHAVYAPDSYFTYYPELVTPAYLDQWAQKQNAAATMGAAPQQLALFHLADEPGWYFPGVLNDVQAAPERLAVFHDYLKAKEMTPQHFDQAGWDAVRPIGLSAAKTLAERRLLYWTARFYAESASAGIGLATQALQRHINGQLLTTANLNNWPGRFFIPSPGAPIANNGDQGPDAAMGMPDWFDLGRKQAVSCIWTEDWFGDPSAQLWSLYGDLLRCAAREGGVAYGGYIIGHTTGAMPEGGLYKTMALAGHGAKAFDYYTFGPNPAFGDGWSENVTVYGNVAAAIKMLGKSEKLLYPGQPRAGTVAILFPQASQVWDDDAALRYYQMELYGLHAALIHAQYPVDFVDDYAVENGALLAHQYTTLYVAAPNLSRKAQEAILAWVKAGGTLALLPNACAVDEYNEPLSLLTAAMGASWAAAPRVACPRDFEVSGLAAQTITVAPDAPVAVTTDATALQTAPLTLNGATALAHFAPGQSALTRMDVEQGTIYSYGYWPGVTYWYSPDRSGARLPQGWAASTRALIMLPAAAAPRYATVSAPLVEAAVLESEQGIAVTLLNWSGDPQQVIVSLPDMRSLVDAQQARRLQVETAALGPVAYTLQGDTLQVTLPLQAVDVLMISR